MRAPIPLALPILMGSASGLVALSLVSVVSADLRPPSVVVATPDAGDEATASPAPTPTSQLEDAARAPAVDVRLAPSAKGVLGAWLVAGPFKAPRAALDAAPPGVDEKALAPALNAVLGNDRDLGNGKRRPPARWALVSSGPPRTGTGQDPGLEGSRTIDLKASLEDAGGSELLAYAAGRLHIEKAGRYYLLLGVDDGVRVFVDGAVVFSRDDARPVRDDDDVIALDLAAGDHDIVLKLHQRDGAWAFRTKLVDGSLAPPAGAYLALPGTNAEVARALAARMSWLVVDRAFDARATPPRYRPVLTVRYPEGAPRGVPLPVTAKLSGVPEASAFDVRAGGVAVNASGVSDLVVSLPAIDPWTGTATLETTVAGRSVKSTLPARPQSERALLRAERARSRVKGDEPWLLPGSLDSFQHIAHRLSRFLARHDGDGEAQADEARELDRLSANLERGVDPYEGRSGMMRRAVVTPFDGAPSELGLYVPPSYKRGDSRKYPLVVGLHGMNSYPMSMMRALFGLDDDKKAPLWKDRHLLPPQDVPSVDAFVITPYAHGNTMYREIGEDDVLHMIKWASTVFPIDDTRITITGPSMGGIGSASIPFHYPHVFAASAPLCGYHSYLIRPDMAARPKRPWERLLLEERSNVFWAENGEHLPLWIVHGTRDHPEANSGVLIERYEKLKYSIKHDHPEAGHNVWGITYGELKGMKWLLSQRLDPNPARVRFRTMRTRYATSAWVTVDALATPTSWGDVDARIKSRTSIALTTSGVSALTLARNEKLVDPRAKIAVTVDGTALAFEASEPLSFHKRPGGGAWEPGAAKHERLVKQGRVTGPIRDVFHEPLLFVYGAGDDARANERVARGFAERPGVVASYPVISDSEFLARGEPLANDRALFLVGRTNKVLAALDSAATNAGTPFPLHVESGAVTLGKERFVGRELGGAFIHPNPVRPDRYVVVVAGADMPGTLRALSLPDLLPDFVVWDEGVAPARGQIVLGAGSLRAGGVFENDWSLPAVLADPLAKTARPSPRSETDATPSLP